MTSFQNEADLSLLSHLGAVIIITEKTFDFSMIIIRMKEKVTLCSKGNDEYYVHRVACT